ncbi:hypothetical protein DSECCO2_179550 [anaerobic digester metagenome]
MKRKLSIVLLVAAICFVNCKQKEENGLPQGAFPIIYRSHLYITGQVDSVKGRYVFDTGASNFYYDSTFFAHNSFIHKNTFKAMLPGVGKRPQSVVVIKDTIEFRFGNNLYKTSLVPVMQLKPILGDFADGILGMQYFYNSVLEICYEKEYMKKHPSIDSINLEGWTKIAMQKRNDRLFIPLKVDVNDSVSISGEFLFDLGSGGSVSLTSVVSQEYNLVNSIDSKVAFFSKYGGVGGESSGYNFFASKVLLGDFTFNNVYASFSTDVSGTLATKKYLGIIGNKIFERFNVYIDFINNNLYLKPNNKFGSPFEASRLGFYYTDRTQTLKSWVVKGFHANTPAQKSGLMVDDRIIAVNDVSVEEISYHQQDSLFSNLSEVSLKVKRNNELLSFSFSLKPVLTVNSKVN